MVYKGDFELYQLAAQPMKSGGEGEIYCIQGKDDLVAKIYKPNILSGELEAKLTYMRNNPPDSSIMNQIAWPKDILRDAGGNFVGFIMPKLSIDTDLKPVYAYDPVNPKIPITYEQRVIVAINICIVISAVHRAGYVFGDFNPLNIGINMKTGHVAFMDTDSYHITDASTGKVYRCGVCLTGYVAPELIQQCKGTDFVNAPLPTFTQETDRFALAIHIFKLLMNGFTPFNGIKETESVSQASPGVGNQAIERDNYCFKQGNKPQSVATPDMSSLSPGIQKLFEKTFINGAKNPQQRATADEWFEALKEYKDGLTQCKKNPGHYYYKKNSACPYCAADDRYQKNLMGGQMTFTNPVGIPKKKGKKFGKRTKNGGTTYTNQNKPFTLGTLFLWIVFFPIMLCITVAKSNLKLIPKLVIIGVTLLLGIGSFIYEFKGALGTAASSKNAVNEMVDGNFMFEKNQTGYTVRVVSENTDLLEGVVEIPSEFKNEAVTEIAEGGFVNCSAVTEFIVPDSVVKIGAGAFKGCASLESITLPFVGESEEIEEPAGNGYKYVLGYIFGYEQMEETLEEYYAQEFANEKPMDIPGEVWQYSYGMISDGNVYYYYIPESLRKVVITRQTTIPVAAFNGCEMLETIEYQSVPSERIEIGEAAFQNCTNLKFSGEDGTVLEVGTTVKSIGASAYKNCKNLKEVIVTSTVRSIGVSAFQGCDSLEKMTLPFVGETVTAASHASEGYKNVLGYIFGYEHMEETLEGYYAQEFANEKPVDIPGEVWQYSYGMVSDGDVYYYYIPESLREVVVSQQNDIPVAAFNGCSMLNKITIPEGSTVGECAFQNCEAEIIKE